MPKLTDYTRWDDAQRHFSKAALWDLLDGDESRLNITHECVDRHPADRLAVRVIDKDGEQVRFTFGELARDAGRFAAWLLANGLQPGDRVALMLEPGPAFYMALFGTMKAGMVAVPLFTAFGPDALAMRVQDCTPRLVVLAPEKAALAGMCGSAGVKIADDGFLSEIAAHHPATPAPTAAGDMAMYQYTSGTTRALPEAVKHRHKAISTVLIAALYGTGIRPGDRFCCPSSPAWGHGLWHGTLAPLALGVEITAWSGPFDPAAFLQALESHAITNLSAAATHYRMLKNCGAAGTFGHDIQKLSFTGEPMDSATEAFVATHFGRPAASMYGTTEVGVILVSYPGAEDYKMRPGTLGKPVPGLIVAVHDSEGCFVPPGTVGEIVLKRRDRWIPTRDLGRMDADGVFSHAGRADDVIISAGWTMSAVEIENTLLKHPAVLEAAAIGVPDAARGQIVKAYIVSDGDAAPELAEKLQEFTRARLSRHEFPRQIAFVPSLPKTPAGKVNRQALRKAAAGEQVNV